MIAVTQQLAIQNAGFGICANVTLPGLMDTPMAVNTRARVSGKSRAEVAAARDAKVPLRTHGHRLGRRQCGAQCATPPAARRADAGDGEIKQE
jgi:NAD(P)-dependent dehydrogenase (short-subunit alcohol dehydrogenase family)